MELPPSRESNAVIVDSIACASVKAVPSQCKVAHGVCGVPR
jgi:hypothetical protein